jgi:hypothetical protein
LKIIDTYHQILALFDKGCFNLNRWKKYINSIYLDSEHLFLDEVKKDEMNGLYSFHDKCLPILNAVAAQSRLLDQAHHSFLAITRDLECKIFTNFGRRLDIDIVFYLGLCNGAGWVTSLKDRTVMFLGIEKIIELNWCSIDAMSGLIFHELGHVYQDAFGVLERHFDSNNQTYLWQLFTEGIAMVFEQKLIGDSEFYHQYDIEWKRWCDQHIDQIKADFSCDLPLMTAKNQRYFGDWVSYDGKGDVGYYLGAKFVQMISEEYSLDDMIHFEIGQVEEMFQRFTR